MADEWGVNYRPRPAMWRIRLARSVLRLLGLDVLEVSEDEFVALGDRLLRWRPTTRTWSLCYQNSRARRGAEQTFRH